MLESLESDDDKSQESDDDEESFRMQDLLVWSEAPIASVDPHETVELHVSGLSKKTTIADLRFFVISLA